MTSTPNLYTCTKEHLMEVAGLSATKATKILNLRKKGQVEMNDLATVAGPGTNWDNLLETGRISLEKPTTEPSASLESSKRKYSC